MWQNKAVAYELLALSFRYPSKGILSEPVYSGEWKEAACEIAEALGVTLPESFTQVSLRLDANSETLASHEDLEHILRVEATRLYVGVREPEVWPYEGMWRAEDDGVPGLLFVNPHSMDVERFMKSCGLGQPEGTNEPLDHVATELEFLQYLASLEAGIAAPPEGAVAAESLPGGSAAAAYAQFMEEHVQTWMPRFASAVQEKSRIPFYRAAGQLLSVLLPVL